MLGWYIDSPFYLQWVLNVNVRHLIHQISSQSTPYEAHKSTTHLVISNEIASSWHVPHHQQGIRCTAPRSDD